MKTNRYMTIIIITFMIASIMIQGQTNADLPDSPTISYLPHDQIIIDEEFDFDRPIGESGVTDGMGTELDPYIIEGWEIEGTGDGSCIYISVPDVYFIIRDCHLFDSVWFNSEVNPPDDRPSGIALFEADYPWLLLLLLP